jgi:alpha-D-xyloside xylohydrolase
MDVSNPGRHASIGGPIMAPFFAALLALADGCTPSPSTAPAAPAAPAAAASRSPAAPDAPVTTTIMSDGAVVPVAGGLLTARFCSAGVVRVAFAPDGHVGGRSAADARTGAAYFERAAAASLVTAPRRCEPVSVDGRYDAGAVTLATSALRLTIDPASGAVTFADASGHVLLAEKQRSVVAATVEGEATHHVRQEWLPAPDESLYGLGQHQQGILDIKGVDIDLRQYNTEVAIPFFVSSRGYGVLWDNPSYTRWGDLSEATPLPGTSGLYASVGAPGDLATASGSIDWSGTVTAPVAGDYTLRTYFTGSMRLEIDGRTVIDHWRQEWLPNDDVARVRLTAGQSVKLHLVWTRAGKSNVARLLWKAAPPDASTSLWSEVGDGVDYWFIHGPEIDDVIAGYRRLTGTAAMLPRWAFGLWQSKERYKTAEEALEVVRQYRKRGIPLDNVVQDWQYWPEGQWGSHEFDPARFPDPAGWVRALHEEHAQVMISVWPRFYPETKNFQELKSAGFLYPRNVAEGTKDFLFHPFATYDAFNPAARRMFWAQIERSLFARGIDAWWLDSSEPEVVQGPFDSFATYLAGTESHLTPTAAGPGPRVLDAYSLVNSQAVYEGQRAAAPNQRVFILTRSGFAGQQRYAAATWSGDITSTWTALAKQIPAGLGFSVSGLPYWTLDTGGFVVPSRFSSPNATPADREEWRELNARWFEYSTFLPILRLHGQYPARELWEFGGEGSPAFRAMVKFDRLRYRLLPYLYSQAGMVTQRGGTLLRPLVMDFREDAAAREVADEFMFGPALLVAPVTKYQARTRDVVLPKGGWYDLWSGAPVTGGRTVQAAAPYDAIPVYARAGAIVPFGPELQYADEKPSDPITLFVYAGADGQFTLYEDQGTTNDYEHGAFAIVPMRWNDAAKTLTLGARTGTFPGVLEKRTFQVVFVHPGAAMGATSPPAHATTVAYTGTKVDVVLR